MALWAYELAAQPKGVNPANIVAHYVDATGKMVTGVNMPGHPPAGFTMPEAQIPLTAVTLANVPAYRWSFGCSATSAAMQAAYYDRIGYYDMYTGPTQGGLMPMDNSSWGTVVIAGETRYQCPLSATRNGVDGRATRGHVDDYWISYGSGAADPYITGGWAQHAWGQCTGDYMGTNQSALSNSDGSTTFFFYDDGSPCCNYAAPAGQKDGCYGLRKFYESRGYTVLSNCTQLISGTAGSFTFAEYKAEINAGRPVLIHVTDHTMLGFGYDNTGSLVYLKDTWDYSTHTMTWGGSYGGLDHWGVTTIQLQAVTPNPCADVISLGNGGAANPKTYWGGGVGVWYNSTASPCGYYCEGIEQVYSFVAPVTGYYSIQVTAASGFVDYMWKSTTCSSAGWNCIGDIASAGTYGSMYWTAGTTYYILLDDENSTEGEHTFYVFYNPCSNVTNIAGSGSGYPQTYSGGGYGAWNTYANSPCEYICPGREKVYSFTPSVTGIYSVEVTAASSWVDYMWKTSSCASTGWNCIDDIYSPGTYGAISMTAGTTYYFLLDDENTTAGAHTFYISLTEAAGTWLGTADSNWDNTANWSAATIPTSAINVYIPGGTPHQPVIGAGTYAYAKAVTIQSGAILTQNAVSYFYVYGNFNSDAGQYIMNGASYLYFAGSADNYWDDDNENDTYTYVRVDKSVSTAQTTMWQNMTVSGSFEVREGVFAIDATWTLNVTQTGTVAFEVESGGKLLLNDETVNCEGDVHFFDGSQLAITGGAIDCGGDFVVDANTLYDIQFTGGILRMHGAGTTYINDLDGGTLQLNDLIINNPGGVCYIKSANLDINGSLNIAGGALSCNNGPSPTAVYNIAIAGSWYNQVGPTAFVESTGTVTFNGTGTQYCYSDAFYNLVVNKASGLLWINSYDVTCATYDWTDGGVLVNGGTFTASNLVDNGIYGLWYCYSNSTINLYNNDGWVDLHGYLYIYGGTFNVYGGNGSDSYWPYFDNAGVTMSSGVLDFKNVGVLVYNTATYSLAENITGGTIRTSRGFNVDRADYHPTGGIVEFYGSTDGTLRTLNGGNVWSILVNKGAADNSGGGSQMVADRTTGTVTSAPMTNTLSMGGTGNIYGDVTLQQGIFAPGANTLYVQGNWDNQVGSSAFTEGTSTVEFSGAASADILSAETFYNVNLNKTYTAFDGLELMQNVTCNNALHIVDGTMEINYPANLTVLGNLTIELDAGLNANDYSGLAVNVGGNWTNANTGYTTIVGFDPGYSVVTFNGTADQFLNTACTAETFYDLTVNKSTGKFRSNDNLVINHDAEITAGGWDDNISGLSHTVYRNFTVQPGAILYNAINQNTFTFTGSLNANLSYLSGSGYFHHLVINKSDGVSVTQYGNTSLQFDGNLTIDNGIYSLNGNTLWVFGNTNVNELGILSLPGGSLLIHSDANTLSVNAGGRIEMLGTAGNAVTLRANVTTARYAFNVLSGGTLAADYTSFYHTGVNGVYLAPGSTVDLAHPLFHCTFQDGASGGTLLGINNSQTLTIRNAVFPTNTWGGNSNVAKTLNTGHVYFVDYSGGFSGEAYDADGFNLIDWIPTLTATATATPSTICSGSTSQMNVVRSGGLGPYTYLWSPSTGLSNPNIINPVANPGTTTTYTVTVTDFLGTAVSSTVTLTVLPYLPVSVSITASANPSPPGSYVLFTATPVNGGTIPAYQWKVNGINVGSGLSTYSYVPSYHDQVKCVLTSNYSCPTGNPATSNIIAMVVVNTNTSVTGSVPSPLTLCFDASNTVTVAGGGTTFTVQSGGSATMIAGVKISYLYGTTVQSGGYMHGYITTSNTYCGGPPKSIVAATGEEQGTGETGFDLTAAGRFKVYPNPTNGTFVLADKAGVAPEAVSVDIFDMRGGRIQSVRYQFDRTHTFDLSGLPAGLYFVQVTSEGRVESFKLVLTR